MSLVSYLRTKPIYEALDNRNNKQALRLCNNLLKKQGNSPISLILKALTLSRMGELHEAETLADTVMSSMPTDEQILNPMLMVYKQINKASKLTPVYENACQQNPNNINFLSSLFMCYMRDRNYMKQQQTAFQMHRISGKSLHYMWAVISSYLNASKIGDNRMITLSQKMCEKQFLEHGFSDLKQLLLYHLILEHQENYTDIISTVKKSPGLIKPDYEEKAVLASAYFNNKDFDTARELYEDLLEHNPCEYSYYQSLTDILFATKSPPCEYILFLEGIKNKFESSTSLDFVRNYYLNLMELYLKLEDSENLAESILTFFYKVSSLPCCFLDLREPFASFLKLATPTSHDHFFSKLSQFIQSQAKNETATALKVFNFHTLRRFAGISFDLRKTITELLALYSQFIHSVATEEEKMGDSLAPKSIDNLLLLASQFSLDLYFSDQAKNFGDLINAIILLKQGLKNSKGNSQLRIALVHAFIILGSIGQALHHFMSERNDTKNMLMETTSYIVADEAFRYGFFAQLDEIFDSITNLHDENTTGTDDALVKAYNHGTFSQIPGIMKFKTRLHNSYLKNCCYTEKVYRSIFQPYRIFPKESLKSNQPNPRRGKKRGMTPIVPDLTILLKSFLNNEVTAASLDPSTMVLNNDFQFYIPALWSNPNSEPTQSSLPAHSSSLLTSAVGRMHLCSDLKKTPTTPYTSLYSLRSSFLQLLKCCITDSGDIDLAFEDVTTFLDSIPEPTTKALWSLILGLFKTLLKKDDHNHTTTTTTNNNNLSLYLQKILDAEKSFENNSIPLLTFSFVDLSSDFFPTLRSIALLLPDFLSYTFLYLRLKQFLLISLYHSPNLTKNQCPAFKTFTTHFAKQCSTILNFTLKFTTNLSSFCSKTSPENIDLILLNDHLSRENALKSLGDKFLADINVSLKATRDILTEMQAINSFLKF